MLTYFLIFLAYYAVGTVVVWYCATRENDIETGDLILLSLWCVIWPIFFITYINHFYCKNRVIFKRRD